MTKFALLFFFILSSHSCVAKRNSESALQSAQSPRGQYKGFVTISHIIKKRVVDTSYDDLAEVYFQDDGYGLTDRVTANMGVFVKSKGESVFINGVPNAVSMSLWYALMNRITCSTLPKCKAGMVNQSSMEINTSLQGVIKEIQSKKKADEADLELLWLQIMSYDAPEEEFTAWKKQVLQNPETTNLQFWIESILMNPYFLLN